MNEQKASQKSSLIGRLFSLESLIVVMGVASLVYGISERKIMNIFWAVMILGGFGVLLLVRRRDWQKHWQELEQHDTKDEEQK